jgi:hypothetical protein
MGGLHVAVNIDIGTDIILRAFSIIFVVIVMISLLRMGLRIAGLPFEGRVRERKGKFCHSQITETLTNFICLYSP